MLEFLGTEESKSDTQSFDYFLDRVKCGAISAQHMSDIMTYAASFTLMFLETTWEEWSRENVVDWFNQEMFDVRSWPADCPLKCQSSGHLNESNFRRKEIRADLGGDHGERESIESHCLAGPGLACGKSCVEFWPMTEAQVGICTDPLSNNDDL